MKKYKEGLFKIGEVTKIMGITRKTLLVYEDMGLLKPAIKDEESGYRYYSADNMTQIRSIRSLHALGLTLKEVEEYYYNTDNIDTYLERLMVLRATLDRNIQMLQVRSAKRGDLTVRKTTLPRQVCFCRWYTCENVGEAAIVLRDTYIAAARTGKMSMIARMFTMRMTHADKLEEAVELIAEGHGGDVYLAEAANHYVIHKVYADGDKLLQHYRQHQPKGFFIKFLIAFKNHCFLRLRPC